MPADLTASTSGLGLGLGLGLLGGSFDPVHNGHLQLARDALQQLPLAQIRFIPAGQPWQKGPITDARQRCEMLRLAIAGEPRFALDAIEIERSGPSYTIDTLRALRERMGASTPLVLIFGGDQLCNLHTWRDWQQLTDFAHLAVARRNDEALILTPPLQEFVAAHAGVAEDLAQTPAGRVVQFEMTPNDASATEIRTLLRQAGTPQRDARVAALLPSPVLDYIQRYSLYR